MNKNRQSLLIALSVALGLSAFAAPAAADSSLGERVATGIGRYIAAQGNAALSEIRSNLAETLGERMELYVPQAPNDINPQPSQNDEGAGQ